MHQQLDFTPEQVLVFLQVNCQGRSNGMRGQDLVAALTNRPSTGGDERQLREMVRKLREYGYPILSAPELGYFWATCPEELERNCNLLRARAKTSLRVATYLKSRALPALQGQLGIPGIDLSPTIPVVAPVDYSRIPRVSIVGHIPEELHQATQAFLESRADWDIDRIYTAAIALFLLQEGIQEVGDIYWQLIEEKAHE